MKLDWIIDEPLNESVRMIMQSAADMCLFVEGVTLPCSVTVRLCDDDAISAVNESYRGVKGATDVLSFPTIQYPAGKTAGTCPNLLRAEYDDEMSACFLGDIIISVPHLFAQAQEYGHSPTREACYLLVHGIFHLMGYDHVEEEGRTLMRAMEEKVLINVSATRDNNLKQQLVQMAQEAMKFSYSPYSHFPVGAAIHCRDGRIFTGCNIENVSFGMTNCAERTAIFKAVSEGAREFDIIAIAANQTPWPCGACRQVMAEFAPDIHILLVNGEYIIEKNLTELLPFSIDLGAKE